MDTEIEIIKFRKINTKKIAAIFFLLFISFLVTFFGFKAYHATKKIIVSKSSTASPYLSGGLGLAANGIDSGDRRINILLLGMGGENHPGGNLTDTILVVSIDPKNKEVAMLSIPRDLHLKVEGFGYRKVNSVLSLGAENSREEDGYEKYELVKKTISQFLDIPIHYFALVNFDGFKEIIDIIGGVDIYVEEDFYDPYFPDQYVEGYDEFFVEKGMNHMDGENALKYARSRETTSDFDRSARQQKIIVAVKEKLLEKENYTSAKRVNQIINILKENFKTDLQLSEIEQLIELTKGVTKEKIYSKVLDDSQDGFLYADNLDGMYVLSPIDSSLKQIHAFVKRYFKDPFIADEKSKIILLNGTGNIYAAKPLLDELKESGYDVYEGNFLEDEDKVYSKTFIYDYTNGEKRYTSEFLSDYFNDVSIIKLKEENPEKDFEIILGSDYLK